MTAASLIGAKLQRLSTFLWPARHGIRHWGLLFVTALCFFGQQSHAQMLREESLGDLGVGWSRAWVDVDGDGRDDLCFLTGLYEKDLKCRLNKVGGGVTLTANDLWQGQYAALSGSIRWSDINGDGAIDICRAVALPSPRLVCRLGPNFSGAPVEVPWTLAVWTSSCPFGSCGGDSGNAFVTQLSPGLATVPGGANLPDFYLADVNGDGIPDLCYLFQASESVKDLRCRLAVVSPDRSSVTYQGEAAAWTLANIAAGAEGWPQGFYDFNADGLPDFCRVLPGGQLRCTLSSPSGFVQSEISSQGAVPVQWSEGAAFVDINGDGNVDFCRLVGSTSAAYIRCTLSNGRGWEFGGPDGNARELISGVLADAGHGYARWWVDINGDGLPDFCRLAATPDPMAGQGYDVSGSLICTLSRGDGTAGAFNPGFSFSDVRLDGINLGVADGGRGFCDATGTGIPTFCRATKRSVPTSEQVCYETENSPVCYTVSDIQSGLFAGFSDTLVSARQPVIEAFSDGVGAETRITYMPLTSPQVYTRSSTAPSLDNRLQLVQPRTPVVFETRAWVLDPSSTSPPALTGLARYLYKDLRSDFKRGSLGFRERWTFHAGANTLDHVVFYQGLGPTVDAGSILYDFREVGAVKCQERLAVMGSLVPDLVNLPAGYLSDSNRKYSNIRAAAQAAPRGGPCSAPDSAPSAANPFVLLQATTSTLGDTVPSNPRIRFTASTTVKSWDWSGNARIAMPTQTSATTMTDLGNVSSIDQVTSDGSGQQWRKLTTNEYQQDNPGAWLLGRLTRSSVKTWTPTADVQLAARSTAVGNSPNAGQLQGASLPQPISPAAMSVIVQLLLDD